MSARRFGGVVPAGGVHSFTFHAGLPLAQCIGIKVFTDGTPLLVSSITVAGVEQLLGGGLPWEFLGLEPLQLDRQLAAHALELTLQNDSAVDVVAEVEVEFVAVEALTLSKRRLH